MMMMMTGRGVCMSVSGVGEGMVMMVMVKGGTWLVVAAASSSSCMYY